jgi:glutathione S-transferase
VGGTAIFESAVILEYLEETQPNPLHPADPLARAEHRAWIEFGSATLNDIWGLYSAAEESAFSAKADALREKLVRVDTRLKGPWFDGERFSLVDAVFGPVFRYFDAFDRIADFGILAGLPKVAAWRSALPGRPSVQSAVSPEYPALLWEFYRTRGSHLSQMMEAKKLAAYTPFGKRVVCSRMARQTGAWPKTPASTAA